MSDNPFAGLNEARDIVHRTAVEKGWWEPQLQQVDSPDGNGYPVPVRALVPRTFGDLIALVHSEASEALEEHRAGRSPDELYYRYKTGPDTRAVDIRRLDGRTEALLPFGWTELTPELALDLGYDAKPDGIPAELADIIIRVLDIAGHYGIDIEHAMLVKAKYNEGRAHRHGGKTL